MSTVVVATVKSNSSSPPVFQNTSGTEIGMLCRAFVSFNGTGTVAIVGSFNVSSITDLGVGSYEVNFATALPDANYVVVGASTSLVGTAISTLVTTFRRDTDVRVVNTTSKATISTCNTQNSTSMDVADVNVAIFR